MFKQFASALISFTALASAKRLECEKDADFDGSTCAQIKRDVDLEDTI